MDLALGDKVFMSDWQDSLWEQIDQVSENRNVYTADKDGNDRTISYHCQLCRLALYKTMTTEKRVPKNSNGGMKVIDTIAEHVFKSHPEIPLGWKARMFAKDYEQSELLRERIDKRIRQFGHPQVLTQAQILAELRSGVVPAMLKQLSGTG